MARQRRPAALTLPFDFVVLGRPYSSQNKTTGYANWYRRILDAVDDAIVAATGNHSYNLLRDKIGVIIVWFSAQSDAPGRPDLDSIIKPLIDATDFATSGNIINRRSRAVIENDNQVHYIRTALVDINAVDIDLPDIVKEKEDDPRFAEGEVIWVQLVQLSDQKASMTDVLI
jgi:hypothetical protein